jgi:hypothetical protein
MPLPARGPRTGQKSRTLGIKSRERVDSPKRVHNVWGTPQDASEAVQPMKFMMFHPMPITWRAVNPKHCCPDTTRACRRCHGQPGRCRRCDRGCRGLPWMSRTATRSQSESGRRHRRRRCRATATTDRTIPARDVRLTVAGEVAGSGKGVAVPARTHLDAGAEEKRGREAGDQHRCTVARELGIQESTLGRWVQDFRPRAITTMRLSPDSRTFADRPRDARSPEEPGRAQFPYTPPAAFTGTRAANGDVTRLTSLVLGRSKAESVSTFKRALVRHPGMLRRSLRRAGRGSTGRSRTPGIVR